MFRAEAGDLARRREALPSSTRCGRSHSKVRPTNRRHVSCARRACFEHLLGARTEGRSILKRFPDSFMETRRVEAAGGGRLAGLTGKTWDVCTGGAGNEGAAGAQRGDMALRVSSSTRCGMAASLPPPSLQQEPHLLSRGRGPHPLPLPTAVPHVSKLAPCISASNEPLPFPELS